MVCTNSQMLRVFVQLRKSAFDERTGYFSSFGELPVVSAFQVSGNRRNIQFEPLCGVLERRLIQELTDGLPLFRGDLEHQGIVQSVNEIDRLVEGFLVRGKGGQNLEFEEAIGLDAFNGPARELKRLAGEPIDRRLNAIGDVADTDADAERQRLKRGAQVQKQGGEGGQLAGNGLKFIARGHAIRQANELLT